MSQETTTPPTPRIKLRGWVKLILALIATLAVLLALYYLFGRVSPGKLYTINAVCQVLLIVAGVVMALKAEEAAKYPIWIIVAFVLLGGVGFVAAMRQQEISTRETAEAQRQAAEANAKLASSIENLNKGAQEISRVQALNTELQQKLLESSGQIYEQGKTISGLSRQAIETTTGGESFCYMLLTEDPDYRARPPVFLHIGKNSLYEVQARIVNFQLVDPLTRQKPLPIDQIMATDTHISLGEVIPESAWIDRQQRIDFNPDNAERQDYRIFFTARNGFWSQDLILQKTDKGWVMATRVFRDKGKNRKLVFTKIDQGFPKNKLKWHS